MTDECRAQTEPATAVCAYIFGTVNCFAWRIVSKCVCVVAPVRLHEVLILNSSRLNIDPPIGIDRIDAL